MITHVRASDNIGKDAHSVESVVAASVPPDREPNVITFSVLEAPKGATIEIREAEGHLVEFGKDQHLVRAIGLLSCAAVCFVNTEHRDDLRGYVYHANSGTVPWETFGEIMKAIEATGPNYRHVDVIYAHPRASDQGYWKNLDELDRWLRNGRVVEVTHLLAPNFGMNQSVQVGY